MSSNFVLEIGGFFLFVAGLLYLTLSGRLMNMFRDRAPKPLFAIALVIGLAIYHWVPMLMLYDPVSQPEAAAPPERPSANFPDDTESAPTPAPKPEVARHSKKVLPPPPEAPKPAEPDHWKIVNVEGAPPPATVVVPPAANRAPTPRLAVLPTDSDPYESKAKRGIKAVGRFLHIQKKTQP